MRCAPVARVARRPGAPHAARIAPRAAPRSPARPGAGAQATSGDGTPACRRGRALDALRATFVGFLFYAPTQTQADMNGAIFQSLLPASDTLLTFLLTNGLATVTSMVLYIPPSPPPSPTVCLDGCNGCSIQGGVVELDIVKIG